MPRILAALILVLSITAAAVAAGQAPPRAIDLNQPGAMEALERSNPAHHEKIGQIMAGLLKRSDREVPRWLQTSFGARDVSYAPILLTSDPPKRRLAFALDGTRYLAVVTLSNLRGVIVPLE